MSSQHLAFPPQRPTGAVYPPAPTRATVEYAVDPRQPGRICYHITHATRAAVQEIMDELCHRVSCGSGYANFVGPTRTATGYEALGQVVVLDGAPR